MAAQLEWRYTGGAANAEPDLSLGGVGSSEPLLEAAANNLFDDVPGTESMAGTTEYRALDLYNAGDATATDVSLYMSAETSSSDSQLDHGVDATDPIDNTTSIASETVAPANVTFGHYTSASKLDLPDIPAGSRCRVWFKRVVASGAAGADEDSGTFVVLYM